MKIEIKHMMILVALFFCLLSVSTWAASYKVSTSTSNVDGRTFCGGSACTSSDTIIISGGARGSIRFRNFDGNGSYITIMNEDTNRVVITHDKQPGKGVLSFDTCKYIDVRGDNNSSFAWSSDCKSAECYGIKVENDGSPNTPAGTVWVYGESDHIKLGYIEVDYPEGAAGNSSTGLMIKDKSLTDDWTFDTFEIHHNYIHDTRYAAMYLGHNAPHDRWNNDECIPDGCPYVASFSIHHNLMEDLGTYGITYKGVNGPNNYIYNNIVRRTGVNTNVTDYNRKHGIGIQYFYSDYYAEVYNNWVEKTHGAGFKVGEANHLIHDNIVAGCGFGNSKLWGHGFALLYYDHMPNRQSRRTQIYNNITIESKRYGIKSNGGSAADHYRNIITESAHGEAYGSNLTEGTGTNANIYEADADNVGFKVWIDDGDYSNDDFSLINKKPGNKVKIVQNFRLKK